MKTFKYIFVAFLSMLAGTAVLGAQEKPEEPDLEELAENEADRLERMLDLEPWQTFYVDSTLKHDYACMMDEVKKLRDSKVTNSSMYMDVQDKWMQAIYDSYHKYFTPEQWALYLKSGGEREQKARDKRRAKADAMAAKSKK